MRVLIILMLISAIAMWPFVALKRPWALRMWQRFKLVIVVYALVIFLAAVFALVFRWDDFYS